MTVEHRILALIDIVLGKNHTSCGDWRDDRMAIELGGADARKELVEIGAPAVPHLTPHVQDIYIRWVLRDIGDAAAGPLIEALTKPWPVRKYVIDVLGELKTSSPEVNDALLTLLPTGDLEQRILVAKALGRRRERRALEPMLGLLREIDADDSLHPNEVLFALGWLGDARAVSVVLSYLDAEDPLVRLGATKALGWLDDQRAVGPLIALLKKETAQGLSPTNHDLICQIAHVLGELGSPRAIPAIQAAVELFRPAVPLYITEALEKLRGEKPQ
jgi:HEAT repeat protein